ncbi:hypothetical protein F4827_001727 [Paraburkholderia bannensis]|uniref:MarR family transcriptional regulator n=1 Tax=Paraburkholderia bannensis TaxID=765414 RepID=A0A7W9WRV5_9BURK|nr:MULTISPECIES: hypothetical protein [Paraburkholderia]MBB3256925.1 hypothetical protein [Paraburkholderia sp. WP4_3_2]MBB6101879.1 hypothetical protein [Paraburkholderia bannensis]
MSIKHGEMETNTEAATQASGIPDLVAVMNAGVRYSARELGKLLGVRAPLLNEMLARALESGTLREAGRSANNRYWIPTAAELAHKARLEQRNWWCQGALTGYDEERTQFRNLCMLVRR